MRVHWRMLGSVIVCVMLVTGLLSPLRTDRVAFSATPEAASQPEIAGLPLRLAAGTFDPLREAAPGKSSLCQDLGEEILFTHLFSPN